MDVVVSLELLKKYNFRDVTFLSDAVLQENGFYKVLAIYFGMLAVIEVKIVDNQSNNY